MTPKSFARVRTGRSRVLSALGAALLATGAALTTPIVPAAPAEAVPAIDQSKGRPGFCPDGVGVTVIVDFQQLGGKPIVRCYPSAAPGTGLDALKGAGFQISGVQRWGEAFICRIENRPAAKESIPIETQPGYREQCINTPPAAAYWSYWHAGNNCQWQYSQWGVKNRSFTPGGFEAWSFSLNATADTNPKPRIAPIRPGTAGQPCTTAPERGPSSNDPNEKQPGLPGSRPADGSAGEPAAPGKQPDAPKAGDDSRAPGKTDGKRPGSGDQRTGSDGQPSSSPGQPVPGATSDPLPDAKPREATPGALPTATGTAGDIEYTGGEQARDVNEVIREEAGASDYAPWIAAAAIVALTALSLWTTRQRRLRREG